jgi:hypothetical protein
MIHISRRVFKNGKSGDAAGRPKGVHSLDTMVQCIPEGGESSVSIAKTIKTALGADKKALEATIIVGLLHAVQGDKDWAKLLWKRGPKAATF